MSGTGNRKVKITQDATGFFRAALIVNANESDGGDAVAFKSFSTLKGAERWAAKELAR